jgi:WhiB family redox-sensing transcriptional regulator
VIALTPVNTAPWLDEAACKGMDPELFFPDRGDPTRYAKAVCADCPVKYDCLRAALEERERFGIWGGMSERERRILRRRLASGVPLDEVVSEALGLDEAAA